MDSIYFLNIDLTELEEHFAKNGEQSQEIKLLLDFMITEKQFRLTKAEALERFPISFNIGVLKEDGIAIRGLDVGLSEYPLCYYYLFRSLQQQYPVELTSGFQALLQHAKQAQLAVVEDKPGNTGGSIFDKYTQFLFIAARLAGKDDPMEELTGFDPASSEYSRFHVVFLANSAAWKYSFDQFWQAVANFAEKIGDYQPGVHDARWIAIHNGLHTFLAKSQDIMTIIDTLTSNIGPGPKGRVAEIGLLWLYQQGHIHIDNIVSWIVAPESTTTAIILLNTTEEFSAQLAADIWKKVCSVTLNESQTALSFQLAVHLLERSNSLERLEIASLEQYLKTAAKIGDRDQTLAVIYSLRGYKRKLSFGLEIFVELLNQDPFFFEYNGAIGQYYWTTDNLDGLFAFIQAYADAGMPLHQNEIGFSFDAFCYHYPTQYCQKVAALVIADEGLRRKAGGTLLYRLLSEQRPNQPPVDIEQLDALQQYKFVISATMHPMMVNELLWSLIPFLSSTFPLVVELTLCKLERVVADYRNDAMDKIALMLENHPSKYQCLERLNAVKDAVAAESKLKYAVREFDARVGYPQLLEKYLGYYVKKTTGSMHDARKNRRGILSLIRQTNIARSGGVIRPDGAVSRLGNFSASFSLPPNIYKDSIIADYELIQFYSTNWNSEFEQWKEIILSSKNT